MGDLGAVQAVDRTGMKAEKRNDAFLPAV